MRARDRRERRENCGQEFLLGIQEVVDSIHIVYGEELVYGKLLKICYDRLTLYIYCGEDKLYAFAVVARVYSCVF